MLSSDPNSERPDNYYKNSQMFNQRKNTTGIKDTMVTNRTITYLKGLSEISPPYCYLSRDYVKEELTSVFGPCHELHYGNDHHPSQSSLQKKKKKNCGMQDLFEKKTQE
jgi:hypothetical protein